jgi:hypothetical protein
MTNVIKFTAKNEYAWTVQQKPVPASTLVPLWWKDMHPYEMGPENPTGKKIIVENQVSNATFKKCTPMLDALLSGYICTLWADVQVRQQKSIDNKFYPKITWRAKYYQGVFQGHQLSSESIPPPTGYSNIVFKYMNTWIPHTPPGYSILVTSPFGYRDLPFYAIPAIIDSDKSNLELLPPMWLKEGFEGIVEAGTPLFQVTPFKRENWRSEFDYLKDGEYEKLEDKSFGKNIVNNYIKNVWSKKSYK